MNRLRELEQAATPGKWRVGHDVGTRNGIWSEQITQQDDDNGEPGYLVAWCHSDWRDEPDAAFIAALRNLAPELLDVVDAAQAWQKAWRDPDASTRLAEDKLDAALAAFDAKEAKR